MKLLIILLTVAMAIYYYNESKHWKESYFSLACQDTHILDELTRNGSGSYIRFVISEAAEACK